MTGCREVAVGQDPFKWDKSSRRLAFLGVGAEADDKACYPRARMAMMEIGRRETQVFIDNRETILTGIGDFTFPEVTSVEERRARAKAITSAFDMDSSLDSWRGRYGNPHGRTLRGFSVRLSDGTQFSVEGYRQAQSRGTAWMERRLGAMIEFIREGKKPGSRDFKKAGRTAKSYVLQEAECTARNAKIAWCRSRGLRVTDLQHDGVVVAGISPGEEEEAARGMGEAATVACGFQVEVDVYMC